MTKRHRDCSLYALTPHMKPRLRSALMCVLQRYAKTRLIREKQRAAAAALSSAAQHGYASHQALTPAQKHMLACSGPSLQMDAHTTLMAAARSGSTAAAAAAFQATPPEQHASLADTQDINGRTALSVASENGHLSVVRLLLSHSTSSAYIYDTDTLVSPLMHAAREGHAEVVAVLLSEGEADAFHEAANGRTASMEAAKSGHSACLELLLEMGGVDVRQGNDEGHPLTEAAAAGNLDALKVLLEAEHAKPNQTNKSGETCLSLAARNGDTRMIEVLAARRVKCIPEYIHQRTPLHWAALNNHLPACLALFHAFGPVITQALDRDGRRPEDLSGCPCVRAALRAARQAC